MTLKNIKLEELQAPASNPRKAINAKTLEGLADSIKTDGVLQNLVVKPIKTKGKNKPTRYRIVAGERRYMALKILVERGEIANDFDVPVEIRTDLSKDDSLRIAAIENLQRENMEPLDEAEALAKLIHNGTTLDDLVAKTGLSANTIKRRCALNNLCDQAKIELSKGIISLAQAQALSLGSESQQTQILEYLTNGTEYDAEEIRGHILDGLPSVAMAIFPISDYTGKLAADLFGEADETYFEDVDQFMDLQSKAVVKLNLHYSETSEWVEVTNGYSTSTWQYENAEEGAKSGVLINFSPTGEVTINEGLIKPEKIDPDTAEETADTPDVPKKKKPLFAKPLCQYIAYHKTMAVQAHLLSHPRKAKEVAVAQLLYKGETHRALDAMSKLANPQSGFEIIDANAKIFAEKLGEDVAPEDAGYDALLCSFYGFNGDLDAYEAVQTLSDDELDELHLLLSLMPFGQKDCLELDTSDTLFNRVAQDIQTDMRKRWRPDTDFLGRRNREQCIVIAKDCGFSDVASLIGGYKKSELVNGLLKHFSHAGQAKKPTEPQKKALNWLPAVMQFPAIKPEEELTE